MKPKPRPPSVAPLMPVLRKLAQFSESPNHKDHCNDFVLFCTYLEGVHPFLTLGDCRKVKRWLEIRGKK